MAVYEEKYEEDDINYIIYVDFDKQSGGYIGTWMCTKCHHGGGSNIPGSTQQKAVRRRIGNLAGHHHMHTARRKRNP